MGAVRQLSKLQMSTKTEPDVEVTDDTTAEDLFGFDLPTNENSENLLRVRHTTAHIMAMAVQKLHPEAQVTIGPWIDQG
jgi:threonyl-tRNA synthetase